MKVRDREFAVYKGDDLLAIGTIKQCAEQLGITEASVAYYRTPTYLSRTTENGRRLVRLEDDDE